MLMAVCHTEGRGWTEVTDLDRLSDLRADSANLLWAEADVTDMNETDVATIAQEFDLHPLAVEDARSRRERPKLEIFEDHHVFVVFHQLDEHDGQLEAVQIACFVGEGYVLTLHDGAQRTIDEVRRRWNEDARDVKRGRTYLMHLMLDVVVDDYQAVADRLEEEIEELEEESLASSDIPMERSALEAERASQLRLYSLKQRLARLRRYVSPTVRILEDVVESPRGAFFTPETVAGFRDVFDHLLRINDQIRNIDELTEAVLELRRSEQAAALNEINKRLTAWAAIIAAPTLISSVYGMNFHLFPADGRRFGFWFALVLMAATSATLFTFFKRRGWL